MSRQWKTVRVFISSTFRDMHIERDHLLRFVFPELKEKCREKRVHFIDVDLRWGVTEADAQDGKALDICLDEIDSCRPYFLGLLGHRYGFVPLGEKYSITANEIYHGVLHKNIPTQILDLRAIIEGKFEGKILAQEQIDCLAGCYPWDAYKGKYILKENVTEYEKSIISSVFCQYLAYQRDRSFFFFRSEDFSRKLAGSDTEDFFESNPKVKNKLAILKREIVDAGLQHFEYDDIETFERQVGETLWKRIETEIGEIGEEGAKDWLEEEAEFHELFAADRTRRFVGRRDLLERIQAFCEQDGEPAVMVITGGPGCGKSALMGRISEVLTHAHPDWQVLPHFIGASPSSTNLRQTLRRLCTHLSRIIDSQDEVPQDIEALVKFFPELLAQLHEKKRIIIILDALNQFEKADNAHTMRWLPQQLFNNVKFVVSTLEGDALDALKTRRFTPIIEQVAGLAESEIRELVTDYLKEIRREFPNPQVEGSFFQKVEDGNPLYIHVALEELRVFGKFEKLSDRVDQLPGAIPALFDQVLERIESDFHPELVRDCMSYIACGKQGMTPEELHTLLFVHAPLMGSRNKPEKFPDMLWARLHRSFDPYLFERSGVIDFFHGQLKDAVGKRYLAKETDRNTTHKIIADYFENRWQEPYTRALDELPHQRTKAEDWDGIEQILTDLGFIEAKCAAGMTYELIFDYQTALDALPEAQEEKQKKIKYDERLRKYTKDLIKYSKGEIDNLKIIPSIKPWSNEKIMKDTERILTHPARLDRIRAFSHFVNSESYALVKFANHKSFCLQQAFNSAKSGPVVSAAERSINSEVEKLFLLQLTSQRPDYRAYPALLRTLEGQTHRPELEGMSASLSADGKIAVSVGKDGTIRVWDLESGKCMRTIEGHKVPPRSISITADGKRAVSGNKDGTLRVWDLEAGQCLRILEKHKRSVSSVSITPDGKRAVSGSSETLKVWNTKTGECLRTIVEPNKGFYLVCISVDGKLAVSISYIPYRPPDSAISVWDIESGDRINKLEGHGDSALSVSVAADVKRAVSASMDKTLRVWDLESGDCLRTIEAFEGLTRSVSITADGKKAVTSCDDQALRVWDLESGECLKTLEGHKGLANRVSINADGKRAVLICDDQALRVWDLEYGQSIETLEDERGPIQIISNSPDGKIVISGSLYHYLQMWDLETGNCIDTVAPYLVKDLPSDKKMALEGHDMMVPTPDRKRSVSITSLIIFEGLKEDSVPKTIESEMRVWDTGSGKCLRTFERPEVINVLPDGSKRYSFPMSVVVNPEGRAVVAKSFPDTLRVWDLENGNCLRTHKWKSFIKNQLSENVSITPDGKIAVLKFSKLVKELAVLWDMEKWQCIREFKGYPIRGLTITPDGKRAVSGSDQSTLWVWDLKSGDCLKKLYGHKAKVVSIAPDGMRAVSGGDDNTLRVWDLESGECLAIYQVKSRVSSLSKVGASGRFAFGTSDSKVIILAPRNFPMGPAIVTPTRIWNFGDQGGRGNWDKYISTGCEWCGQRFPTFPEILDVINAINNDVNLTVEQSPCLHLPVEAWDETKLLSECPLCHKPIKYNPFIVDNSHYFDTSFHTTVPHPTAHPSADPEHASILNLKYQKELEKWKALPWRKRIKISKPKPPRGI